MHSELLEDPVHDGRSRLGGPGAGQLPLGREGKTADPRSSIAGGLADEKETSVLPQFEVVDEPLAPEVGGGVLVEGCSNLRVREATHERRGV